jgi:hypothetical protein
MPGQGRRPVYSDMISKEQWWDDSIGKPHKP